MTAERLDTLREADWIVIDEIKAANLYRSLWQSFAILTPVRSVGVMGDGRTYANVVAIRAVTSEDGMTADWAKLPYEVLEDQQPHRQRSAGRQPGRVRHLVLPPATIEWEQQGLSRGLSELRDSPRAACADAETGTPATPDRWGIPTV